MYEAWPSITALFLVYCVTLSLFPGVLAEDLKVGQGGGAGEGQLFFLWGQDGHKEKDGDKLRWRGGLYIRPL